MRVTDTQVVILTYANPNDFEGILCRWLDLSDSAKELAMGMLQYNPKTRLTAKQVSKTDPLIARTGLPFCANGRR